MTQPIIGAELKRLRIEAGLGLRETARRSSMAPSNLHAFEHGRRSASLASVSRICETLGAVLEITTRIDRGKVSYRVRGRMVER